MFSRITDIKHWSIRTKFALIVGSVTFFILLVNVLLLYNINHITDEIGSIYESNIQLNELASTLDMVQENMTGYLNTKSTDYMENYYRYEQELKHQMEDLSDSVTANAIQLAEKNTRSMLETYLRCTDDAIEAKRGRNVPKYRVTYEETTRLHAYITEFISDLNQEHFAENAGNYIRLTTAMRSIEAICLAVYLIASVMGIFLVIVLSNEITTPLSHLAKAAGQVTRGNYNVSLSENTVEDEVGIVTDAFRTMVVSIQDNIVKLRENMEKEQEMKERELIMEAHLKDAQLKYLQAQINPHFLFNTLNAGAQLAMMEGADRAYEYIQQVASFFRYNIQKNNKDVTLAEELSLADTYIYILNVRFAGDIGYTKEIDENLLSARIPAMTLQPIVENCISHGIRNISWPGEIRIQVYRKEDRICISIRDNGAGMSQERICEVLEKGREAINGSQDGDSNGIGMKNVISRLELMYDRDDLVEIRSDGKDQGTEVILYIPMEVLHV